MAPVAPAQPAAPDADLPGRVGRVADVAGELFLSAQERAADWTGIGLNTTITTGDNLWVSAEGRAEVDYGGGQFRLAGDTNLHVARLDDTQLALFVAQGHVIVRVRVLDAGEAARVDTPNAQIQLLRPGLYRIDVDRERQVTQLVVREGEANVWLPSGSQQVLPGQTAIVTGADAPSGEVRNGAAQDSFDAWSASRDRRYEGSRSAAYVSRQMVGVADLDDNGTWNTDATYGAVWFPTRVADDWAPYRYGSWSWLPGWGWTWVDDAPWGYAPFHYGRWAFVGSRWGWIPGGYIARPVWAPALVGWYGGSGWSVSVRAGAPVFGWVPLGWGDPYLPSWNNCSRRCWTMYNRPYAVNYAERPHAPPARYSNYGVPGAITAVGGATLAGRKPVAFNRVAVPRDVAASAPVLSTAPALKPVAVPSPRHGAGGAAAGRAFRALGEVRVRRPGRKVGPGAGDHRWCARAAASPVGTRASAAAAPRVGARAPAAVAPAPWGRQSPSSAGRAATQGASATPSVPSGTSMSGASASPAAPAVRPAPAPTAPVSAPPRRLRLRSGSGQAAARPLLADRRPRPRGERRRRPGTIPSRRSARPQRRRGGAADVRRGGRGAAGCRLGQRRADAAAGSAFRARRRDPAGAAVRSRRRRRHLRPRCRGRRPRRSCPAALPDRRAADGGPRRCPRRFRAEPRRDPRRLHRRFRTAGAGANAKPVPKPDAAVAVPDKPAR